jgi:4,5-DOPA dioxygenase extradiol
MTQRTFPTLFVSHGSPMIVLEESPARDFLEAFGRELGKPQAILIASAHFETSEPRLTEDKNPRMIYDFGGFPRELYEVEYAAPGAPDLAARASDLLRHAGFSAAPLAGRGYDHGTWTPLKLMYPDADVPVVQLSVQPQAGAAHHVALGRALGPLRTEGVLLMGSGTTTHNLFAYSQVRRIPGYPTPSWVAEFGDWIHDRAEAGAVEDIAAWESKAPHARENHPTPDHFLPLPFAMSAARPGARGKRIHSSAQSGVMLMDAYAFE